MPFMSTIIPVTKAVSVVPLFDLIFLRCPSDATLQYHSAPIAGVQRFSLEAFKFIADHPFVFLHCHVILCNASDPGSICNKSCSSSDRRRREVGFQANDVYTLGEGPIYLVRGKEEEKKSSSLDMRGMYHGSCSLVFAIELK